MFAYQRLVHVVVALGLALLATPLGGADTETGSSSIDEWIWHFDETMQDDVGPTYTAWLRVLPRDALVTVVVCDGKSQRDATRWLESEGRLDDRVRFLTAPGPISPWARDRYVLMRGSSGQTAIVPPLDQVSEIWRGDASVPARIADVRPDVTVRSTRLALEGGDVLVADEVVFVGRHSIESNADRLKVGIGEIVRELEVTFQRRLVVLGTDEAETPHAHADMYLTPIGKRRVLLGDPRLTRAYFDAVRDLGREEGPVREFGTLTWRCQEAFAPMYDEIATSLREEGFDVVRIPVVHAENELVLTWNNVVIDDHRGRRIVYMPTYGVPFLDRVASKVWTEAGFDVRAVDCAGAIIQGGALRCLSNPLRRAGD